MTRRAWLAAAAVGALAGAAGIGWSLRRSNERRAEPVRTDTSADLWALVLDTPSGGKLELASLRGRPLVLNFWATWCAPCVREMPVLDRFFSEFKPRGWQVLGLAADSVAPVREFLARTPVGYPIAMAGFAGIELSRQLGNTAGGLPFTVLFDRNARVAQRHTGETTHEQLAHWAAGIS